MIRRAAMTALVCCAAAAPSAHAADQIYWPNGNLNSFAFANLSGGGGDLSIFDTPTMNVDDPQGMVFDPATGRMYWGNSSSGKPVSFSNLDGTGGDLNAVGAGGPPDPGYAFGVALDPVGRRIYWPNEAPTPNVISFANLDGSGGGDLNTGAATVSGVEGITLDPVARRVYWANTDVDKISFANLDGSGGQDINTGTANVDGPTGVAIDPAAGRIYWVHSTGVSFAQLDGSAAGNLNTTGATVQDAGGPAIDAAAGRIYWANDGGNVISFARLDGSGGEDLSTPESTLAGPNSVTLVEKPTAAGAPAITGKRATGSTLTCSQGTWAPDVIPAFLYRSPLRFAFQWSRDGKDIAGATSATIRASSRGRYVCRVTGTNLAGSATQTSAARRVLPGFGRRTRVTLSLAGRPAGGFLRVVVKNANAFAIAGRLSGRTAGAARKLPAKSFKVSARAKRTVKLRLHGAASRVRLTAKLKDPAGTRRVVRSTLKVGGR